MFQNQLSQLGNFQGIQLESDIAVITLDDNISHTYCSKIKWEKDNRIPLGIARLTMPYDKAIEKYWVKYSGPVVIHANLNSHPQSLTQAMMSNFPNTTSLNMKSIAEEQVENKTDKKTNKIHLKNDEYNYSYIGKVARFKQVGETFIVFLEDLGWKFLQKVPKEFRDTYIAGQTLDDAFQAICEFMGVEFAYSIEDLSKFNFASDGYSVEKDGQIIEDVVTILSEWSNKKEDEENNDTGVESDEQLAKNLEDNQPFEATGLMSYKKKKKAEEKSKKTNNTNTALNSKITNTIQSSTTSGTEESEESEETEEDTNTVSDKINMYQEEFDDKIKDLFIGNNLYDSNIADPILNYNWITITPKAPAPNISTANNDSANNSENNEDNTNNNSNSNTNEATT